MEELLSYWKDVFRDFEVTDKKFTIPDFPEPMMSIDFNKPIEGIFIRTFTRPEIGVETLSEAIGKEEFWDFMTENYPQALPFLEKLLPFLVQRNATHHHYYMRVNGVLVASQLVGESGDISFFFNGVVHRDFRRKGLLREIIHFAKHRMQTPKAFFWTTHEWLDH